MKLLTHLLVRKRAIIAASLSLIIFSGTISVLMGIGAAPASVIGNPDAYVISSKSSGGSLLNSRVDLRLSDLLLEQGFVTNASPEIFAFAEIDGNAVIIRGVEFEAFMGVEKAVLYSGAMPTDPSEALLGKRLADRLGAVIGDRYPLVGTFNPSVSEVRIAGIIESNSGTNDELVVSLPIARCLVGISLGSVSVIRVLGDSAQLDILFGPGNANFAIYDFSVSNRIVGTGQTVHLSLLVKNWGDLNGTAQVSIIDEFDNTTLFGGDVNISRGTTHTIGVNCSFSAIGEHALTAHLNGTLAQEIQTNVTVKGPFLSIVAPEQVAEYHNFTVLVIDQTLEAVGSAAVTLDGHNYTTDAQGRCIVNDTLLPGNYTILANSTGYEQAEMTIGVIDSSSLSPTALIRPYLITITPNALKVKENCTIAVYIQNYGNSSGLQTVATYINGNLYSQRQVFLDPLEVIVLFYNRSFSFSGDFAVTSGSISTVVSVESQVEINPTLVQLVVRYGGIGTLNPSRADLIYQTTKISEANILIVLVSLAVLSGVLVTLGVSTAFMKEINENMRIVGILRSLGASSRQLLMIIFKEAFLLSMIAVVLGIVGGFILALLVASTGNLIAFGHLIQPVLDPSFLLADIVGSILICVGSSLIAGFAASRRRSIRMIRGLKDDVAPQVTLKEMLGDE